MESANISKIKSDLHAAEEVHQEIDKLTDIEELDQLAINQVQLLLSEKRTSLSVLRTGLAVLVLPMSVMSLLVATSKYYDVIQVLHIFIPLGILNFILIVFGVYLIIRAILSMRHYDRLIQELKAKNSFIRKFIE